MINEETKSYNGIPLRPTEYEVLKYFLSNPNVIVPRGQVIKAVWGNRKAVSLKAVDQHLHNLRKKISNLPIKSRSKFGFIYEP